MTDRAGQAKGEKRSRPWCGEPWFAIPFDWVDSGLIRTMSLSELRTILSLAGHAGFHSGQTRPGTKRIARESGHDARTVGRALRSLKSRGVVELIEEGGGRGRANVYRLCRGNPGDRAEVSGSETPAKAACKPRSGATETPAWQVENPGGAADPTEGRQRTEQQQKGAAADVMEALTEAGIGEPKRSELADLPHITPAIVRKAAREASENGKGTGVIVMEIAAQCAAERLRADGERRKNLEEQKRKRAEEADRRRVEQERQRADAILAAATPEERAEARSKALAAATPPLRKSWAWQAPDSESMGFRFAMVGQLLGGQRLDHDG
jgi:hypothetical protein